MNIENNNKMHFEVWDNARSAEYNVENVLRHVTHDACSNEAPLLWYNIHRVTNLNEWSANARLTMIHGLREYEYTK